jgi:diguanylate cyclase (GGDEF)-like protein
LPFVFSDGEVRGYLVIHNFSEGKFFRMEEKNILEISSMLVKSKLEILSNFRKIEKISKTDFLTGLPNRNEIENIAITEVERCNRDQSYNFSLALIDLDNFKYYNDTFGHMIGDLILKEFASLLRATVRKIDFVGRYGGDEFVVIMPSTDRNKAVLAAKRWIRKIFSSDFYMDILRSFSGSQVYIPEDKKLSMSVGVADFKEVGYNIQELFELADKRLYVSKSKGKSVVT